MFLAVADQRAALMYACGFVGMKVLVELGIVDYQFDLCEKTRVFVAALRDLAVICPLVHYGVECASDQQCRLPCLLTLSKLHAQHTNLSTPAFATEGPCSFACIYCMYGLYN